MLSRMLPLRVEMVPPDNVRLQDKLMVCVWGRAPELRATELANEIVRVPLTVYPVVGSCQFEKTSVPLIVQGPVRGFMLLVYVTDTEPPVGFDSMPEYE
jgi:hypothetical protein